MFDSNQKKRAVCLMTFLLLCACIGRVAGVSGVMAQATVEFQIIVHLENRQAAISRKELGRFFLKKVKTWESGLEVEPVDLPEKLPVRVNFTTRVLNKSMRSVRSYWHTKIFSGREIPPTVMANEQDVVNYIKDHPGAIGYVSSSFPIEGVKVLRVEN